MRKIKTVTQFRLKDLIVCSIALIGMYMFAHAPLLSYACIGFEILSIILLIEIIVKLNKTKKLTTKLKNEGICVESEIIKITQAPHYFAKHITYRFECKVVIDEVEHFINSELLPVPFELVNEFKFKSQFYYDKDDINNYILEISGIDELQEKLEEENIN